MEKIRLSFSLAVVLFASTCFAQSGWFTIQSGLPQGNDLFFPTADVGYIVGDDGFARKSTDGGLTWLPMKIESDYKGKANFLSISFPTFQIGYIAGNEYSGFGIILKTTDAGNTWNKTSYSLPYYINHKIIFPSSTVGYITTDFTNDNSNYVYMLMKSKDGGNVWEMLDSSVNVSIEQMVWKTENLGLFMSNHLGDPPESYLSYTSDGGKTILGAHTGISDKTAVGVGEGNVWYIGYHYNLYRSEDTNFNWVSTNGTPNGDLQWGTFFIPNGSSSYCVTTGYPGPTIFKTSDNGLNWFDQFQDTTLSPVAGYAPTLQIAFLLASYDFLSTKKWKILKTIDGGGPALNEVQSYTNFEISLFPNPTSGILSVYNAPENLTSISILNVLGQKVMELSNPHSSAFTIDISKLTAGMYYLRFARENSVDLRKIIKE